MGRIRFSLLHPVVPFDPVNISALEKRFVLDRIYRIDRIMLALLDPSDPV